MMMMRKIYLVFLISLLSTVAYSALITQDQALEKATQFWYSKNGTTLRLAPSISLAYTCKDSLSLLRSSSTSLTTADTTSYFYIFNIGEQGFVIISGDDVVKTVLGYSDEGSFSALQMPDNVKCWLNYYYSAIKAAINNSISTTALDTTVKDQGSAPSTGTGTVWLDAANAAGSAGSAEAVTTLSETSKVSVAQTFSDSVQPLLGNIKWGQEEPYYNQCPYDEDAETYTYTGCIATVMAQIMKYHEWPVTGTGSKRYLHVDYGYQYANFGATTYYWDNMLDSYGGTTTDSEKDAVATLMYHCGVSVEMDYSTDGSGAYLNDAGTALRDYFGYDDDLQYHARDYYTASQWTNLIKEEIDASRPVLYSATSGSYGHAFVCDGYDSDGFFHFNWGYTGMYNGYFELSVLNFYSDEVYTTGGYSTDQSIIAGIQKPDGVSDPIWQLVLYSKGLTSSVSSLSSESSSFNLSFGFINIGLNDFEGYFGVALYKDSVFQKVLSSEELSLPSFYGSTDYSISNLTLSSLSPGAYQIYTVFKPTGSSDWSHFAPSNELNNYLNVVIDGTSVTLTQPADQPVLTLSDTLQLVGNAYNGKTARFNVSIQNTGKEFYSNIGVYLYKVGSSTIAQYVDYGAVCIPSGETRTFAISGTLTCSAGTYYAVAVFDSTNAFSTTKYKVLTPSDYNKVTVTVQEKPSTASLSLDSPVAFSSNSTTVYKNQAVTLNATVTNAGGYFDSYLVAFIFPESGGYNVGYLDPKTIYIDENETQTVSLTGSIDLDAGNYLLAVYYYLSENWTLVSPESYSLYSFTIENVTGLSNAGLADSWSVYPNPAVDVVSLLSPAKTKSVRICDLSGRLVLETSETQNIPVGSLHPGLYMLQAVNEDGTTRTFRFIKK